MRIDLYNQKTKLLSFMRIVLDYHYVITRHAGVPNEAADGRKPPCYLLLGRLLGYNDISVLPPRPFVARPSEACSQQPLTVLLAVFLFN